MAGTHGYILSTSKWIQKTRAIGIRTSVGRYGGGTFAHKDIAFEFATWLSPEFKLYLIKEFQRLKNQESLNAEYIRTGIPQGERLLLLNESAIHQMKSLQSNQNLIKKLK